MGNYTKKVKFTKTNLYGCGKFGEDDVYTVEEFIECCKDGSFIDDDGWGYPVKDKKADRGVIIYPSIVHLIPEDATHIVWYNQ